MCLDDENPAFRCRWCPEKPFSRSEFLVEYSDNPWNTELQSLRIATNEISYPHFGIAKHLACLESAMEFDHRQVLSLLDDLMKPLSTVKSKSSSRCESRLAIIVQLPFRSFQSERWTRTDPDHQSDLLECLRTLYRGECIDRLDCVHRSESADLLPICRHSSSASGTIIHLWKSTLVVVASARIQHSRWSDSFPFVIVRRSSRSDPTFRRRYLSFIGKVSAELADFVASVEAKSRSHASWPDVLSEWDIVSTDPMDPNEPYEFICHSNFIFALFTGMHSRSFATALLTELQIFLGNAIRNRTGRSSQIPSETIPQRFYSTTDALEPARLDNRQQSCVASTAVWRSAHVCSNRSRPARHSSNLANRARFVRCQRSFVHFSRADIIDLSEATNTRRLSRRVSDHN